MATDFTKQRRLAAIVFVDMAGFTAVANRNEQLALELLEELRALLRPIVQQFQGTEIKSLGDGFLLEFSSTSVAVNCALHAQSVLEERNSRTPSERRIQVRIGVHLGDIEHQDGDVLGNDVNIAQRVQSLARPGEVWFTEPVYQQVRNQVPKRIYSAGAKPLKHISRPLRLYCVPQAGKWRAFTLWVSRVEGLRWLLAAFTVLAVAAFGLGVAMQGRFKGTPPVQLAVLPFETIPDDPENRDFSSGLVQTLCSALTQLGSLKSGLQVVPFNEVHQAGVSSPRAALKVFGANRVITGSVQRQGTRLRVILNLVDSAGPRLLSSAKIDHTAGDIYTLQDELASQTASMLQVSLPAAAQAALSAGQTRVEGAYESYLRGLGKLARFDKQENLDGAIVDFEAALEKDKAYALAFAGLAEAYWRKYDHTKVERWKDRALEENALALKFGSGVPRVHLVAGLIASGTARLDEAMDHFQKVVERDPANTEVYFGLAQVCEAQANPAGAEKNYKIAIQRIPQYWAGYNRLGTFYTRLSRYEDALNCFKKAAELTPDNYSVLANLGATYYLIGRYSEATDALRRSLNLRPTADAYCNLGMVYFFQRQFPQAVQMFEEAVAMDSNNALFLGNLADAYRVSGADPARMRETYQRAAQLAFRALEINPKDAATRALLATYQAGLGDFDSAVLEIEKARAQAPADMPICFLSALVHEQAKQRERALAELQSAVRGGYSRLEVLGHPDLAELRADPKFLSFSNTFLKPAQNGKANKHAQ